MRAKKARDLRHATRDQLSYLIRVDQRREKAWKKLSWIRRLWLRLRKRHYVAPVFSFNRGYRRLKKSYKVWRKAA